MSTRPGEIELQLDGLVGPTHHFGGLASGNLASASNAARVSNPRAAALQGLAKLRAVADLGVPVGILPPRERPHLGFLRSIGFEGDDATVIAGAAKEAPDVLSAAASASAMWAANAATVSAGADTADGRVHVTPANLVSHLHRSLESAETTSMLRAVFADPDHFVVHEPLPATGGFSDEGAANHTRLVGSDGSATTLFVYGREGETVMRTHADTHAGTPPRVHAGRRFGSRQARAASEAVARTHGLVEPVFACQSPDAVDAGAFHHDVVGVGDRDLLLMHARALSAGDDAIARLRARVAGLEVVLVTDDRLTLAEAVETYLFNSQLVSSGPSSQVARTIVADRRAVAHERGGAVIDQLVADGHVSEVVPVDLDESMRNGGGPACLRLRVPLTADELDAVDPGFVVDVERIAALEQWVRLHYRERLVADDLGDPALLVEVRTALDELTSLLGTGPLYSFQR